MKNSNSQLEKSEPPEENQFSWRSEFYAWFVVFLLIMAFSLSMVDRMILTLLVGPIKADFGLSDTEISLLHGLAFTLLYVIAGIPLGRLTDRYSRRMIAGFSVFFWSIATCLCGIANNFAHLFISRIFVGVGEAGLSPAATSLISDYFPVSKLSRPIAYFSIGGSLGAGLAFIFGGAVADMVVEIGNVSIPFIGEIRSWQLAFFIVGLPGLLFAASFFFVKEPARSGEIKSEPKSIPISEVLRLLSDKAGFLTAHFFAAAMSALVVLSIHAWMPAFLMRKYSLTAGEAGYGYGVMVLIGGVSGLLLAGWYADKLTEKGVEGAHIKVAFTGVLIAILPAIFAPIVDNYYLCLALCLFAVFGFAAAIALSPVALQIVIPNRMRGQVFALYLLIISLLGYAIGPLLVALITDYVFKDELLVGYSISLVATIFGPISAIAYLISRKKYKLL